MQQLVANRRPRVAIATPPFCLFLEVVGAGILILHGPNVLLERSFILIAMIKTRPIKQINDDFDRRNGMNYQQLLYGLSA